MRPVGEFSSIQLGAMLTYRFIRCDLRAFAGGMLNPRMIHRPLMASTLMAEPCTRLLEPDPKLAMAGERTQPTTGLPGAPPPGFFGPRPPMFGPPGFAGMGPLGSSEGEPPRPSRREPLVSQADWTVSTSGNQQLDHAIVQDLRLEPDDDGLTVAKTAASGGFWLLRKIDRPGDFTASCQVSVPSIMDLSSIAGPGTLLAVGAYSTDEGEGGAMAPAPPPLPIGSREFQIDIRRAQGRTTLDVAGTPVGGSVMTNGDVLLGLYARGGIRFSIRNFTISPSADEPVANQAETPSATPSPKPPALRVWTDASGTRQIEATFIQLKDGKALFRRQDGTEAVIALDGLSSDDQAIVKRLAEP